MERAHSYLSSGDSSLEFRDMHMIYEKPVRFQKTIVYLKYFVRTLNASVSSKILWTYNVNGNTLTLL